MPKQAAFKTRIAMLRHLPGMHYIEVPKQVVDSLGGIARVRLICSVNKRISFQCGLVALGQGRAYISITKKRMKDLGVSLGDQVTVVLKPDKSKYGMPMPPELKEVLAQDEQGKLRFEKLTPGRQRYIIHYVSSVKNSDKRIERALLLIENLKTLPEGQESFRAMLGLPPREL